LPRHPLSDVSLDAVKNAIAAANRAVPVMWTSLVELRSRFLHRANVVRLNSVSRAADVPEGAVVDGASLGLPVALAVISATLGLPCPVDTLATARLTPTGDTGRVEGLATKLVTAGLTAQQVRYVLVDGNNELDANAASDALKAQGIALRVERVENWPGRSIPEQSSARGLTVLLVSSLADAVRVLWPSDVLHDHLQELMRQPRRREAIAEALFHIALGDQRSALAWEPVQRAASHTLEHLESEISRFAWQLRFAQTVASRHSGGVPSIALPTEGIEQVHFHELPLPHRLLMAAHIVQNAATCASPDPAQTEVWAKALLPTNDLDCMEGHLKLRGALGRLIAVLGRPAEALEHQLTVHRGWLALRGWSEVSYSVSEWFRLASLIEKAPEGGGLAEAEEAFLNLGAVGEHIFDDYMMHYRCRARVVCPEEPWTALTLDEAVMHLRSVWEQARKPSSLRWSSLRWLIVAVTLRDGTAAAAALLDEAERSVAGQVGVTPLVYRALIDMDRGHEPQAALNRLFGTRPQPTRMLIQGACSAHADPASWVARWWS